MNFSNTYSIEGRVEVGLAFNDVEFPFTKASNFGLVHLSSSTKLGVPMLYCQITDNIDFIASNPLSLVEGAKITLFLRPREKDSKVYEFRLNSLTVRKEQSGDQITFDGYLDYPKWWIETTRESYIGMSSSAVLEKLAFNGGLQFQGDLTNDQQNWYGLNYRVHDFAKRICQAGYVNDFSCMQLALTLDGVLRYYNVETMGSPSYTFSLLELKEGKIPVVSFQPRNLGGTPNRRSTYSSTLLEQNPLSPTLHKIQKGIAISLDEQGKINLNEDVKNLVTQAYHKVGPINYGNVTESYQRARYQNSRSSLLFSQGLEIVTPMPTLSLSLDPLDTVLIEAGGPVAEFAGLYRVASKSILIKQAEYHEKFELARRSVSSTNSRTSTTSNLQSFADLEGTLYSDES